MMGRSVASGFWADSGAMSMKVELRLLKGHSTLMVDNLARMLVWSWMMLEVGSWMTTRVLAAKVMHCATVNDPIHSVASFVIIVRIVLEGL